MSRYIDAEWLIKEAMPLSFSIQKWVNEVQINDAPSIDIVRCKECKKADTRKCPFYSAKWGYTDDDFCSCGERQTERSE